MFILAEENVYKVFFISISFFGMLPSFRILGGFMKWGLINKATEKRPKLGGRVAKYVEAFCHQLQVANLCMFLVQTNQYYFNKTLVMYFLFRTVHCIIKMYMKKKK